MDGHPSLSEAGQNPAYRPAHRPPVDNALLTGTLSPSPEALPRGKPRPLALTARVHVHPEEGGGYWAEVIDMPGVFVSGDSIGELREALTEAIGLYLSSASVEVTIKELRMTPIDGDDDGSEEYLVAIPA